jgi:hypothetical protein
MDKRLSLQQGLFVLQLTTGGALFSFALSSPSRTRFLLILSFTSYALCARYCLHHFENMEAAAYVRESLSDRTPGGLLWEEWILHYPPENRFVGLADPLYLTFPGIAGLALIWDTPYVFTSRGGLSVAGRIWFGAIWTGGLVATALSVYLIWHVTLFWRRTLVAHAQPSEGELPEQ